MATEMTANLKVVQDNDQRSPRIVAIGVGGAGGNAVDNMIQSNLDGVEFLVANTDAQALDHSLCERRILLGGDITQGLGAGSSPKLGRAATEGTLKEVLAELEGADVVFITTGMGGGTGTGGAPVIARMMLHDRLTVPVDCGLSFVDGRLLLGPRKTVVGLLSSALATTLVALILGVSWQSGLLVAVGAMVGDLLSSFIKRRLGVAPHGVVLGLDQFPEALLPLLLLKAQFALDGWNFVIILAGFCVTEWCLSYLVDRFDLLRTKPG